MWRSLVSRLVRVQEAVGSNPATPTKNPQIFVQKAQKSEDSSFAKPGKLCETPTPVNAEKSDHRSDYLADMLTRTRRSKEGQKRCVFQSFSAFFACSNALQTGDSSSPVCSFIFSPLFMYACEIFLFVYVSQYLTFPLFVNNIVYMLLKKGTFCTPFIRRNQHPSLLPIWYSEGSFFTARLPQEDIPAEE